MFRFIIVIGYIYLLSSCSSIQLYQGSTNKIIDKLDKKEEEKQTSDQTFQDKCPKNYTVKKGDTLSAIAQRCSVKQTLLIEINHLTAPYWLEVGQELFLSGKGKEIQIPVNNFIWPVKNAKNYHFEKDQNGSALVINATRGTKIYAVESGRVAYVGDGVGDFGNLIMIKHENGYLTLYAHANEILVKERQQVKQGQVIATIGKTGDAKRSQLYLEVRYRGKKVSAKNNFKK